MPYISPSRSIYTLQLKYDIAFGNIYIIGGGYVIGICGASVSTGPSHLWSKDISYLSLDLREGIALYELIATRKAEVLAPQYIFRLA